jgi:hypothetical protein
MKEHSGIIFVLPTEIYIHPVLISTSSASPVSLAYYKPLCPIKQELIRYHSFFEKSIRMKTS